MGREARVFKNLTKKQSRFVKELVSGKSATQAVIQSYNVTSIKTASVIASQNLNKLSIREALDAALRTNGLTIDVITLNIGNIANKVPAKLSGDTVLKANVELLKLHGAYPDRKNNQVIYNARSRIESLSYDEAKKELERIQIDTQGFINDSES